MTTLYFGIESRFHADFSGVVRSATPGDSYEHWTQWFAAFDEVVVLARVDLEPRQDGFVVEGPHVRVVRLPYYHGPAQLVGSFIKTFLVIRRACTDRTAVYGAKLPGVIGTMLLTIGRRRMARTLVNVVGDPEDVLHSRVLGSLGMAVAPMVKAVMRRLVATSDIAIYVSSRYLQAKYPGGHSTSQLARSNVRLDPSQFASPRRSSSIANDGDFRISAVGSQDQLYKGHDLLIRAIASLREQGKRISLDLVGGGARSDDLRQLALELGVEQHVNFRGHVSGIARVTEILDHSQLFAMPSRTEGLPRSLVEAMARGLPCIGSRVGAIPELLDESAIFAPDSVGELINAIDHAYTDDEWRNQQSRRNIEKARDMVEQASPERFETFLRRAVARKHVNEHRPRTVVHVLGSLNRGGVETRTLELLSRLASEPREFRFLMVTLSGDTGTLADAYQRIGAEIVPLSIRSIGFPIRFLALLRRVSADAVHSHVALTSGPILALAGLAGVRTRIAHLRSTWAGRNHTVFGRVQTSLSRLLIDVFATHVVGVSPGALAAWRPDWGKRQKARVLPNGFDLSRFTTPRADALRKTLDVPSTSVLIAHVGRADIPTKNREGAIDALAEVVRRGIDARLVFVGRDGASASDALRNRRSWQERIESHGLGSRVSFLGERDDVAEILIVSDVLLLTSTLEGLPGALIEGRLAGLPVVSTDLPGSRFIADQLEGLKLVDSNAGVADWADAIIESTATWLTLETREHAREAVRGSIFDLEVVAKHYRRLWTE